MHNIRENNGKYNIIYRLPIIFFSEFASWIICFLFFELPISFVNLSEFKDNIHEQKENKKDKKKIIYGDIGEYNITIEKFKKKFKIIRIVIYIFSFIITSINWYYISCFFSIFENTQIHLLKDFRSGLIMNLVISIIKSFLYGIYKYIFDRIYRFKKCLKTLYEILNKKIVIFIIEVLAEILVIYISKQFNSLQKIQNLFD